ncbi:MAG: energy-coupling factor ABC transporter permease [Coriobacteriia bacterium]|nr:energy-coupling factor ABC transporter permease [Coriobacteriia bacterium]MBN2821752.1 energy-coupling factor ABC transporter permease [Coriobacteriia bacterium]
MHMADALISPAVGGAMWAATAVTTVYCAKKVRDELDDRKVPLMGVVGAFIFAAQMLNFTIPATGSSGHLGGGLILAVLLGPYAAFLVMASVLSVQALFFADGGLLALGANIFNMGFLSVFIAYPLVYRKIVGSDPTRTRLFTGSLIAAIVGLQLGAFGVVAETTLSGISELPFGTFVAVMQPIHLGIGIVEGLVTAAVVLFVQRAQPELLTRTAQRQRLGGLNLKPVLIGLLGVALVSGALLSWYASSNPDGLEWSIAKVTGSEELEAADADVHTASADLQEKTSFLPDYGFRNGSAEDANAGTSLSGVVGAALTLAFAVLIGFVLKKRSGSAPSRE